MAEPDSVGATAKPLIHSSDEYSDDEINPTSMLDVRKRGHIPGQYKEDAHLAEDGVSREPVDTVPSVEVSANKNRKKSGPPVPPKPKITLSDSLRSYDTCDDLPMSLLSGNSIKADKPKPVPKPRGKSKRVSAPEMIAETTVEKAISEKDYMNVKDVAFPENVVVEMDTGNKKDDDGMQNVTMSSDHDTAVSDSLLPKPENEPVITASCNKIELDKSTESDHDTAVSDSLLILAEPENEPVITASCNQIELDKSTESDNDTAVSDSLVILAEPENEPVITASCNQIELDKSTESDNDTAVSDSLVILAEPENEPVITASCNKIELDKSTESDKVPNVIDSSLNDSVVMEGDIEISSSAKASDLSDKDDSMKHNGAVGITVEAVTETASKRAEDIEACEDSESSESFESVEEGLSEEEEIFLDSKSDDKSIEKPTHSDSIKQLPSNNEVGTELEEMQSSGDMISHELDSGQSIVDIFNDDIEYAGYESIDSAESTGDHCSLGSKSTDLSTMTSFEILSQGETSVSESDKIDVGNDKREKHHMNVDRVKDEENDCIKLQHIAIESKNCSKTASHTEAIELSIKESDECPLSKENSAPPSVTDAYTDRNKHHSTVADTEEEAKVVNIETDNLEHQHIDTDAKESTMAASKAQSIEGSTKGSNESQKSQGDSVPPPIMPKSETVLESLQVKQGKVETPNLKQVSQSESGNKPFEVTPDPLPQMQGDKSSVESSSPQIQNEPTPPPVMPKSEAVLQSMQSLQTFINESSNVQLDLEPEKENVSLEQKSFPDNNSDEITFASLPKEQTEYTLTGANFPQQQTYYTLPRSGYQGGFSNVLPQQGTPPQPGFWPQPYPYHGIYPYSPYQQQQQPYMPNQSPGGFMQQIRVPSHTDNVDSKAGVLHRNVDVKKTPNRSFSPHNQPSAVSHDKTLKCEVDTSSLKQTAAVKTPPSQPKPAKRQHKQSSQQAKKIDKPEYDTPKTSRPQKRVPNRRPQKPKVVDEPKEFCIQFKGISPDTTPDTLTNIIEIATELETDSEKVVLNESKDCAWVILNAKPDLENLKERINRKGINGSHPIVSEVPLSSIPSKTEKKPVPVRRDLSKLEKRSSTPEEREVVKKHEESLIFLKGINPVTKEENIRNFVETATKGTIDLIIFNYARVDCVVHIEGDSTPDLSKLRSKVERTGLEGFKPELTEMPLPTSIAVSSLSTIGSLESLGLYFESKHSCGDTTLQDPYESEDGTCCIVEYEKHEVVKRVCMKKDHQYNKMALRVSPYYKCDLGVIWDANLHTVVLPDPVTIDVDKLTFRFLQKDCCVDLSTQLEKHYCKVTFTNNGVRLECLITPKIQGFKQLAQDWQEASTNVVHKYIEDTVKKERVVSDEKAWNDLMEYFQTEKFESRDGILTSQCATSYEIEIIGFEMSVNECFKMLKSKQEEIKKRLNRKKQTFERTALEVELLKKIKVFEKAKAEIEDLTVEYASDSITVEAQPDDIKSVRLQLVEVSNYIKKGQWKHNLSTYCVEFVQTNLRPKINEIFEDKGIILVWTICVYNLEFYVYKNSDSEAADSEDEGDDICDVVVNTMQDTITEKIVPCDMKNVDILQSNEWTTFIEMITEKYEMSAEQEVVVNKVHVYGLSSEVNKLQKEVEQFIAEHSVMLRQIDCGAIELKFMKKHKGTFLSDLERKYSSKKMSLSPRGDKVEVCATKAGLKIAEIELSKFSNSIVCEKYVVEKVAVKEVMRDEHEQGTLDKIETETRCIIQLPCEEETLLDSFQVVTLEDVEPTDQATASDLQGSSQPRDVKKSNVFKATNGVTITLVKGELHTQDGDVMVVTTSPTLNLSSGKACKSILHAAGQEMQDECKQKYPNDIKFGEIAVVHGRGSLECNRVYFTTLPNWSKHEDPKQVLGKVMKDSLEMAAKHNKYSIIFSAMGTGQLRYPVDIVAMVMYDSVIEFDKTNAGTTLKDVKFILYQKDYGTIKAFEEEAKLRISGDGERPTFDYQTGPIKIQVVVENIAQQQVDAIFCTTSKTMDLRHGACQAILRSGGKALEEECKSKYNNQLDDGQVVEIGSGNLPCKCLFLTVLPGYRPDALNDLKKAIETMLALCDAKKVSSVAMPALGTGNLRYPKQEVCDTMFDTISNWAKTQPTCLKNVRFIMHAKDHDVVQTFQSYVRTAVGRGQRKGRDSICHSIASPLGATGSQPKKARYNATNNKFTIGKINLSVLLGDLLQQKADVIVNSVNSDFALIGGVAQALAKQCPSVGRECKKPENITKLQKKHIVRTPCRELGANCIFHLKHTEKLSEWTGRMKLCLEKANRHKFKSIAFPVLGTGQGFTQFSPEDIASCMFDAIDELENAHKLTNVKDVRLIVFKRQPQMLDMILKKMHDKMQEAVSPKDGSLLTFISQGMQKGKKLIDRLLNSDMAPEEREKVKKKTSSMTIQIYSDDKANIEKCKIELEAKLEKQYSKKKIEDYAELVKTLKQDEIDMLDVPALVNINTDPQSGIISINGPTKQVDAAIHELRLKLLKIERSKNEANNAEELFKIVKWHYEEIMDNGDVTPKPYNKEMNYKIEEAYKANKTDLKFTSDDHTYVVDFQKLVEYDESDKNDSVRVIRKDILKDSKGALPGDWAKMKDDQNLSTVTLAPTDAKYKTIEQKFLTEVKGGSYSHRVQFSFDPNNLRVLKIERVQNKTLYQQYQAKKKYMSEQKPSLPPNMPIERELWHGMKPEVIPSIQNHGFNRSYSGDANGQPWFGDGVYFAGDASYSCRGWLTGAKPGMKSHIFLVNVLTGQFCKGTKGMRYLPAVDPKTPTVMYDSAVDDPANPFEFVIFNDTQAYPAYLVTYTS